MNNLNDQENEGGYQWSLTKLKTPDEIRFPRRTIFPHRTIYRLTNDERYVICGDSKIYYLELGSNDNEWKESKINYPKGNCTSLMMMGDRVMDGVIVNGFIREVDMEIPEEIRMMIFRWYCCEEIHTIDAMSDRQNGKSYHWKIDIHQIIPEY